MVHGFNGTSRLWRMPAAAIRRGSVFEVSGAGVARLAERAAKNEWLGERTHEGFGRFRLDAALPGVTSEVRATSAPTPVADIGGGGHRGEDPGVVQRAQVAGEARRWERSASRASRSGSISSAA